MAQLIKAPSACRRSTLGLLAFILLLAISWRSDAEEFNEYQLKAVFLFNFAQFVEWSPRPTNDQQAPFIIGVLGDDPFNGFLDKTIEGEATHGRPFVIQRYRSTDQISNCDILFIGSNDADHIKQALAKLKGRNILTVGDARDFARLGGIVQFVTENHRIRLTINVDAAKAAQLIISSKLLRPATIVSEEKS